MKLLHIFESLGFNTLKDKLLSLGGTDVNEVYEENLSELLQKGVLFNPSKVVIVKMDVSKCHSNSACFWGNYTNEHGKESLKIATGWVLDGEKWYQHSWLYQPKTNKIIETTHKRKLYFGYILSTEEAERFYFDNY